MHSIENRPVTGPEHFSLHAFVCNWGSEGVKCKAKSGKIRQ